MNIIHRLEYLVEPEYQIEFPDDLKKINVESLHSKDGLGGIYISDEKKKFLKL